MSIRSHTANGHCVFQACTIIASSPVTFRNLIITSTISSAGVKVPSWLRGNTVVMIVILPCYALALQAAVKSSPLPFPDAFWSEYFLRVSAEEWRAWALINTSYIKHEANVPAQRAGCTNLCISPGTRLSEPLLTFAFLRVGVRH